MMRVLREQIKKLNPLTKIPYPNYILLAILILGFLLRVYRISTLPLYGDELTMVYDSYSLYLTGKDQTGEAFPLTFKMGAGRPAGYVYLSIPFVAVFGPSVLGIRSLSIISGLGIIILMYFLAKKLFGFKVGLMASFLTSISMWDIYLSRAGFEAHLALFLALFGIVMFLYEKYIPWAFFWGLTIFTYPTFKLTLPILFLVLIFYKGIKNAFKNKSFIISLVVLTIFGIFAVKETFKGLSEERFLTINVFSDTKLKEAVTQKINEERYLSLLPLEVKPFVYNKVFAYTRILFENYMENISIRFLFLRGDGNPRHNPGEWGMLYLAELPLLFIGLFTLWREGLKDSLKKKKLILILSLILITPLAPMFIPESAHALRNCLLIPGFILLSSYALTKISKKTKLIFIGLMIIQLMAVLITIYFYAPNKFLTFWSGRAKELSELVINNKNNYKTIVLSTKIDNIEYAYQVYAKIDPNLVISQYGSLPKIYDNVVITDKTDDFKNIPNVLILEK